MLLEFLFTELAVNIPIAVLSLVLFRLCAGIWRKLYSSGSFLPLGLLALYMALMYAVTGIPSIRYCRFHPQVNFIPFSDFQDSRYLWLSGMNVLMTLPLGVLLPLCWKQYQRFSKTVAVGALVSLSVELSQMFCFRATDIDDFLYNTLGTALGYFLGKLLLRRLWARTGQGKGGFWVLNGILVFFCFFLRQELYDLAAMLL